MQKHFIKKSSISISLIFVLLITLVLAIFLPLALKKEDDSYGYSGGNGTASNPYLISTVSDFATMSNAGSATDGVFFKQTKNLTLGSFQPAGYNATLGNISSRAFQGNYDGGGYTITYTAVTCTESAGLFALALNATISNVNVTSCSINTTALTSGSYYIGGIVGYARNANIINCTVQSNITITKANTYTTASVFALGGIVGCADGAGVIERCGYRGANLSLNCAGYGYLGGIVGYVYNSSGTGLGYSYNGYSIKNCTSLVSSSFSGSVSGQFLFMGGIVGGMQGSYLYNFADNTECISGCFTQGAGVTARASGGGLYVGGIIGLCASGYSLIKNCYNRFGSISVGGAQNQMTVVGGICGYGVSAGVPRIVNCYNTSSITDVTEENTKTYLGGIAGYYGLASNCFNTGAITATTTTNVKSIVGYGNIGSYCYYSGTSPSNQGKAIDNTSLKTQSFYETASNWNGLYLWDFNSIWTISSSYPTLQWKTIESWIETYDTSWRGNGTEASPYFITTAEELAGIAFMVNYGGVNFASSYFKQSANIDLSRLPWVPIGRHADGTHFSGNYDGNNYKISNMYFEDSTHVPGLFGVCYGAIKNVIIDGADLSINSVWGGSIVGLLETGASIENCTSNAVIEASSQSSLIGGIVGNSWRATIKNCHFTGSITSGADTVGGIVGEAYGEEAIMEQCTFSGAIKTSSINVGGIAGALNNYSKISKCISKGNVKGAGNVGSIAGKVVNGSISNSAGYGNIAVTVSSGNIAGIIGSVEPAATMTNCTFVGAANTIVHPFACNPSALTYSGCYTVINGVKYYTKGDFSGFTPTTYMNNGYPMQNELYSVAIGGYTSDQVITNLKNLGFELYF